MKWIEEPAHLPPQRRVPRPVGAESCRFTWLDIDLNVRAEKVPQPDAQDVRARLHPLAEGLAEWSHTHAFAVDIHGKPSGSRIAYPLIVVDDDDLTHVTGWA
jgi:hypothetical protein